MLSRILLVPPFLAATATALPAPAAADEAPEIMVTARRQAESAASVPLTISTMGSDDLSRTGTFTIGRIQQLVPSVQFQSSNPRNSALTIRGLGAPFGLTNDGIEQGVGVYVDDVFEARPAAATFDLFDIERVEVLRGPQATLYGKNVTAGAVNITTAQPTFDFTGKAEASVGNLGFRQVKAAVAGPLSETVAGRIAFSSTGRRGTIYNVTTRHWINAQDNFGARAALLWQADDRLAVTLRGDYQVQDPDCCAQIFAGVMPTQRPASRQYPALAAALGYQPPSTDPFARTTDVDAELRARNKTGGVSLKGELDLGDGRLASVSAWRFWDWNPASDRDFTGLPVTTRSQNPTRQNQWSEELRYAHSGQRFDIVAGLFGIYQTVRTRGVQEQGPAASRWLLNPGSALAAIPAVLDGLRSDNDIGLDSASAAAFAQLGWKISDRFTLRPGVRLNYDWKKGWYGSAVTGTASDGSRQPVLFSGPYATDPWIAAARGVLAPQQFRARYSDWNLSYDVNASYHLDTKTLFYATYAHTFKTGGINLNGVPADADGRPLLAAATVKPETVDHYEAGVKTTLDPMGLSMSAALFRTDIADYQALVTNGQLGVLRGYLANAGTVRSEGFEWEARIRPSPRLSAYFAGAYTDATYRRFVDAPCPPELSGGGSGTPVAPAGVPGNSPANCDISGSRLPGVSKWALSYGAEANVPARLLGADGELYLAVDLQSRSRFSSNASPSAWMWVGGYTLTAFRAGFRGPGRFDVAAFVRNAFDVHYFEQLATTPGNSGLIAGQPGDPRTFGLTVSAGF